MATDQQMTVARTAKSLPPAQISKSTRQVVPAFLQKLYEMVNDPKNHDLIRWSEAGDSFFVLDHERFAHDVLGRWFKHRNFSSFVRQLNIVLELCPCAFSPRPARYAVPYPAQKTANQSTIDESLEVRNVVADQPSVIQLQQQQDGIPNEEQATRSPAASLTALILTSYTPLNDLFLKVWFHKLTSITLRLLGPATSTNINELLASEDFPHPPLRAFTLGGHLDEKRQLEQSLHRLKVAFHDETV
ncbi:hypothetical protein NMY22_g9701 [Coprinellus aureogranulatus]|nr:hypothetical protein NMY22_g9701 [Coprinellus aureogranulatus]